MAGTKAGGLKASKTNRERYGKDYYAEMGRKGGRKGHTGGFASNPGLARIAGSKGGMKSRRSGGMQKKLKEIFEPFIVSELDKGSSLHYIAKRIGVSDSTIKRFCQDNNLISSDYTPVYKSVKNN